MYHFWSLLLRTVTSAGNGATVYDAMVHGKGAQFDSAVAGSKLPIRKKFTMNSSCHSGGYRRWSTSS